MARRFVKPYAWTTREKKSPKLRRKLERCVLAVKARMSKRCRRRIVKGQKLGVGTGCVNPWAACRARLKKR